METAPLLVIAVDHPSLSGALERFLDDLRAERACSGRGLPTARTPYPALIDQLNAPRTMRLGVMAGTLMIAVASVDNEGAVALAVAKDFRRRGIANTLMDVVVERAEAIGYPTLHRYTTSSVRLAG